MSQFLQSYGIWIVVGILLLVLLVLFARAGSTQTRGRQAPQTGSEKDGRDGGNNRHS